MPSPPEERDLPADSPQETVPNAEGLWSASELQVAGSETGRLPYFLRSYGQDADGGLYLLVSEKGVPVGNTGAVLELVSPEDGESLSDDNGEE